MGSIFSKHLHRAGIWFTNGYLVLLSYFIYFTLFCQHGIKRTVLFSQPLEYWIADFILCGFIILWLQIYSSTMNMEIRFSVVYELELYTHYYFLFSSLCPSSWKEAFYIGNISFSLGLQSPSKPEVGCYNPALSFFQPLKRIAWESAVFLLFLFSVSTFTALWFNSNRYHMFAFRERLWGAYIS